VREGGLHTVIGDREEKIMSTITIGDRDMAKRPSTGRLAVPAYVRGIPAQTWQSALRRRRGSGLHVQTP
jgi:hypothetical protein